MALDETTLQEKQVLLQLWQVEDLHELDFQTAKSRRARSVEEAMLKTDARQANWRRTDPARYDARLAVQRAVKAGELEKQACEVCGIEAVDAHHDQYDEPLPALGRNDGHWV